MSRSALQQRAMAHKDFDAILAFTDEWRSRLAEIKSDNPPQGFSWYGYDILSSVHLLDLTLAGPGRDVFITMDCPHIADIGAADGDLGFMLSELGFDVDLIDHPSTNWNGMRGMRAIKDHLDSKASIHDVDLDTQFNLPRNDYGLVILLGILYHLKNPFYVLEKIARSTRHCLLSTRIARFAGNASIAIDDLPIAYLLDAGEANNDATNYWIFSDAGLRRLVDRCGFDVVAFKTFGDTTESNPSGMDHDERAFLLLRSRHGR